MSAAPNIKFVPPVPDKPRTRPTSKRGYTLLDNENELTLLGGLNNALVKPALFLLSQRYRKTGVHWGEIATFAKRGQTQIHAALRELQSLGLVEPDGENWKWRDQKNRVSNRKSAGKSPESRRKVAMKKRENAVQDDKERIPKEVSNEINKKQQHHARAKTASPGPDALQTAGIAAEQVQEQQLVSDVQRPIEGPQGTGTGQDLEEVPAPPVAAYNAAIGVLREAKMLDIWRDWIKDNRLTTTRQEKQAVAWAAWVEKGLADALRREAGEVMECNYEHPQRGLKARMEKTQLGQQSAANAQQSVRAAFGEPICQPGERRAAPSGRVWTVAYVEYGLVYFEEAESPNDQSDIHVAKWPLQGVEA